MGFTSIAEKIPADKLISQLDENFSGFDYIIEKYGIEKIKTIGDSYMCVSGIPSEIENNAEIAINVALDMQDFMKNFNSTKKIQNRPEFEFRIGIHTGPVVAGVVGVTKFAYDIWGDTVNLTSQMEQQSQAGKINISGATYELVKDKFNCTYRGKIAAKNKGGIDMYFVDSKK